MAVNKDTRKIKEVGEYTTSPARRKLIINLQNKTMNRWLQV